MIRFLSSRRKAMNSEWQNSKDNQGVCGADSWEAGRPELMEIRNDYRWSPACQRAFLEALSCTGSVMRAAKEVSKSPRSAYDLRFRRDGAAFRLGWDAAILVSRDVINDMLMDRAVNGYEEVTSKQDDGTTMRGKFDNRLGKGLLDRLDRMAEAQALQGSRNAQVQLIVQDFESFLELIERGGKGSDAALFFEARDPTPPEQKRAFDCELDRISAAEQAVPDMLDEEPEVAATRLGVWFDEDEHEWRTNFPKPEGEDAEFTTETGFFGDEDYERSLSDTEESAHLAALARVRQPWIDAAAKARDAWFGEKLAA
jgi:hypothetical protein